jgi:L-asparaginase
MAEQVESKGGLEPVRQSLYAVINAVYPMLLNGESAAERIP